MTKAAEKAAAVRARKVEAFCKRVRQLVGHVFVEGSELLDAFEAGKHADTFAAEVAAREPVGKAVHAMKLEAMDYAETKLRARIEETLAKLEAAGWDRNAYCPYPSFRTPEHEAKPMRAKHNWVHSITSGKGSHRSGQPDIAERSERGIDRQVQMIREGTALEYDKFICKMVAKVGECHEATLEGNHVWGHSILTVITDEQKVVRWKTQQIVNYSVLGNAYYQWPSRIVK